MQQECDKTAISSMISMMATDSDSVCLGSNPSSPARLRKQGQRSDPKHFFNRRGGPIDVVVDHIRGPVQSAARSAPPNHFSRCSESKIAVRLPDLIRWVSRPLSGKWNRLATEVRGTDVRTMAVSSAAWRGGRRYGRVDWMRPACAAEKAQR